MPGLDATRPFIPVGIAILTVSDTRTLADDKSGDTLQARILDAGHTLVDRAIVTDDKALIRARVEAWTKQDDIDVVITTGGTGFTGRDVTPEALEPLFEKKMDGFSEVFTAFPMTRSARRRSSHAPRAALPMRPSSSCCPARPAPARTPGTAF